ncbi:MAG: Bax inhibitor-1 family protein [Kluyvera sp.]|uniref:Bax inhibitor-1 family protein n=1 Tax=Kluyvera sp. TaxID=1538228 RepID=UPI003A8B3CC5
MMIGVWLLTAAGLWATAAVTWATVIYCEAFALELHPVAIFGAFLLLIVGGYYLMEPLHRLSTAAAVVFYLAFIALAGIFSGNIFTWQGVVVVLGITGAMFAVSACLCWCVDMNPGSVRQIIIMIVCGTLIAIGVNSLLDSRPSRWFYSLFTAVLWAVTAGCEKETLHGYARKLYAAEFYTLPRCIVLGAMTIYLGVIAFFRRLIMGVMNILSGFWIP